MVDIYLIFNLDQLAQIVGGCWAATGFIYLLVLTRGFRRSTPDLNVEETSPADAPNGASTPV
jgi:hypothetical protein